MLTQTKMYVSKYAFAADPTKMRYERMQKLIKSKHFYNSTRYGISMAR